MINSAEHESLNAQYDKIIKKYSILGLDIPRMLLFLLINVIGIFNIYERAGKRFITSAPGYYCAMLHALSITAFENGNCRASRLENNSLDIFNKDPRKLLL